MKKLVGAVIASISLFATQASYRQQDMHIRITGGVNASQIMTSKNLTDLLWRHSAGVALEKNVISDLSRWNIADKAASSP